MKTQLLEDIGQSATLSLVPSDTVVSNRSHKAAPARAATPARPRSASGVWRQKPAGEPVDVVTQQPDQAPPLPEIPPPFEPVAAVEAQYVPPRPPHQAAIAPVEPTLDVEQAQSAPAPQGPVFDFTPPSPAAPGPDLFKHEPARAERSGRRYLLWGSCVLASALAIQAGWWLYAEREDAGTLALVADELKAEPQFDKAVKRRAVGAKEMTLGPDGEVTVAPAAPAIPPLVLLTPERGAESTPAAPLPKAIQHTEHERPVPAIKPARAKLERAPDRQLVRQVAMQAEKKPEPESAMSATLKACREHGYLAAQCVKHACSVTKYGFVCRGK